MSADEMEMWTIPVVGPWPPTPEPAVQAIPAYYKTEPAEPRPESIEVTQIGPHEWLLGPPDGTSRKKEED